MTRLLAGASGSFFGCGIVAALVAHNYQVGFTAAVLAFGLLFASVVHFIVKKEDM